MREKTCCFTGHRSIPPGEREELAQRLEKTILRLYQNGVCYFGAGGALGFDTLAARAVLRLREEYPDVKLILVLPCLSQTKGWRPEDAAEYDQIKSHHAQTQSLSGGPQRCLRLLSDKGQRRYGLHCPVC